MFLLLSCCCHEDAPDTCLCKSAVLKLISRHGKHLTVRRSLRNVPGIIGVLYQGQVVYGCVEWTWPCCHSGVVLKLPSSYLLIVYLRFMLEPPWQYFVTILRLVCHYLDATLKTLISHWYDIYDTLTLPVINIKVALTLLWQAIRFTLILTLILLPSEVVMTIPWYK